MKKNFTALLLAAACTAIPVFSLTACSDTDDKGKAEDNNAQHSLNYVENKEATIFDEGNTEYWYCNHCDKYYSDKDGNNQITLNETVIPKVVIKDFVMPQNGFDINSPVEITFYHTMGSALKDVLTEHIEEFNALYPNITVKDISVGNYGDLLDRTKNEIIYGKQPNIAYCYGDHIPEYNVNNAVLSFDGFLPDGQYKDIKITRKNGTQEQLGLTKAQEEDFIEAFYNGGRQFADGKMYTLPVTKATEVLYYNKTFFDKFNLSVPRTWEEMENVCEIIKHLDPKSTPLGIDSESNLFINMCAQYGSSYTSASGEILFDNAANRSFVEKIKGWYDNGYLLTQQTYGAYTSSLLAEGKSYMSIGSTSGASHYRINIDGKRNEVGIAPVPQVDPDNAKVIAQGPSVCIFKQDDPQEVLASWLFVKYLTTNIEFQAQFSYASQYLPVIKSVKTHPVYALLLGMADGYDNVASLATKVCLENTASFFTPPAFVGSDKARTAVSNLMVSVLEDKWTLDDAFKYAVSECNKN